MAKHWRILSLVPATFLAEGTSFTATAGKESQGPFANQIQLIEALKTIYDPEIPVNIYDLGLIYKVEQGEKRRCGRGYDAHCPRLPCGRHLSGQVAETLAALNGVGVVRVTLVWDPPWTRVRCQKMLEWCLKYKILCA